VSLAISFIIFYPTANTITMTVTLAMKRTIRKNKYILSLNYLNFYLTTEVLAVQTKRTRRNYTTPRPMNIIYMIVNFCRSLHSHMPSAISAIAASPKIMFKNFMIKKRVGLPAFIIYLAMVLYIYYNFLFPQCYTIYISYHKYSVLLHPLYKIFLKLQVGFL